MTVLHGQNGRRAGRLALLGAAVLAGCGTGGTVIGGDGGPDGGTDAGPPADVTRPEIEAVTPASESVGLPETASFVVRFSEPMAADAGSVHLGADGADVALEALAWDAEGRELTVTPSAALPSRARVVLRVEADFEDLAGNTLGGPTLATYEIGDGVGPRVAASTPALDATDVSARLDLLVVSFDETMRTSAGSVRLEGTPGTLGASRWRDPSTLLVPVTALAYGTSYGLVLEGFEDAAGNALDDARLSGGAIHFATGADTDAPRVSDSSPAEGQVNVPTLSTESLIVVFDEPMDTSTTSVELDVAGTVATLPAAWSTDGRTLTLPAAGYLAPDGPHSLRLSSLRDAAGNLLDPGPHLGGDGSLDFVTGADDRAPIATYSAPAEGTATGARWSTGEILVVFDRAMSTAATRFLLEGPEGDVEVPGAWNLAGTELRLDVGGLLRAAASYRVDLSGLEDPRGRALDTSDPYLGDGALDFTTVLGAGENCRDVLEAGAATPSPAGGLTWSIAPSQVEARDGGCERCANNPAYLSPDAVLHVHKTSAAASAGGSYLHVGVVSDTTDLVVVQVLGASCDAGAAATTQLACPGAAHDWDQWLDVGAGDYYVWVAHAGSGRAFPFAGASVTVEELPAVPDGESCAAPFTTRSAIHATVGGAHVWTLPANGGNGADMTTEVAGEGRLSCDADGRVGADVVVEITKTSSSSVLSVIAEPAAAGTTLTSVSMEVLAACDPRASDRRSLACETDIRSGARRVDLRGAAGTYYVWLGTYAVEGELPAMSLRTTELEPAPGESCASAIAIASSGTTPIAPASTERLDAPSCVSATTGVTWYRFTATERASVVRADVPGALALLDPATLTESACSADSIASTLGAFVPVGTDVCVAVPTELGAHALTVDPVAYDGVLGHPTSLEILRPLGTTGSEMTISSSSWLTVTPTTLYMGVGTNGFLSAPRAGGARAEWQSLASYQTGVTAVSLGEAVFALDDTGSGTGAPADGTRLYRIVTPAGAFPASPEDWDGATAYPSSLAYRGLAYDGTSLWVANDYRASPLAPVTFLRGSPSTPGLLSNEGTVAGLTDAVAIAADATWLYVMGAASGTSGIFRVRRSELPLDPDPTPQLVVAMSVPGTRASLALDSTASATLLYFRDASGNVRVVHDPGGATPRELGTLSSLGRSTDHVMAYDPVGRALYVFETETVTTGNFVRLD